MKWTILPRGAGESVVNVSRSEAVASLITSSKPGSWNGGVPHRNSSIFAGSTSMPTTSCPDCVMKPDWTSPGNRI